MDLNHRCLLRGIVTLQVTALGHSANLPSKSKLEPRAEEESATWKLQSSRSYQLS